MALVTAAGLTIVSAITGAAAHAAPSAGAAGAAPATTVLDTRFKAGNYVVTLVAPPAASYRGGVAGFRATKPTAGKHLDATSSAVRSYRSHLLQQQSGIARSAGVTPRAQYTIALNGFAAKLSATQAARLAGTRGVLSVTPDTRRKPVLFDTPNLLGLTGADGVWSRLGGARNAGKGVVVGVLDTGVWPENPFFAGSRVTAKSPGGVGSTYRGPGGKIHVVKADGSEFVGTCQAGEDFPARTCNSKLVGARFYDEGYLTGISPGDLDPDEYLSPRDGDSHGSHTSSTAVGNRIPSMTVAGRTFGASSGMAPAAKLAMYKVLWNARDDSQDGGTTSDILHAIDDAVSDGVDVINYSIGGNSPSGAADPVGIAFLNAAAAGVFVAAAAGNAGPDASTVDNNSPWVTTVAATTAHRLEGTVKLGDGTLLKGASFSTTEVPATAAILGDAAADSGVAAEDARVCLQDSLDPAKVSGKIVVCDRGVNNRVDKSAEVKRAGGVGMVLVNVSVNSLDPDVHSVPTVHLPVDDRDTVRDYVSGTTNPTIALLVGDQTGGSPTPIPVVAGFSSRGPDLTSGGDLVKPDISAPGVGIVAAVAPPHNAGDNFGVESGTSMASPHIAGLGALILGTYPTWSPMEVKSAIMTTAFNTKNDDGSANTKPFEQGAGFVNPRRFLTPGLVYDSDVIDWIAYLEGTGLDTGTGIEPIDPSDLNLPSIGIGELAGSQTVTRRVTAQTPGTYRASVQVPGFAVTVSPSTLRFGAAGQTKEFTVSFTRTTAPLNAYATGFLTWTSSSGLRVRDPIAVQPVTIAAPAEVTGSGTSGSTSYQVTPGLTGSIDLSVAGLVPGEVHDDSVAVGPLVLDPTGNAANKVFPLEVPDGTTLARFDLVAGNAGDDMDLFVLDSSGALVAYSATGSASERVDLPDPPTGTYYAVVNGYASAGGGTDAFSLRNFAVHGTAGNLTASPDPLPATQSVPTTVTVAWSGLDAGTPYLGTVSYEGSSSRTAVAIG